MTINDPTLSREDFLQLSPAEQNRYLVEMHGASNRWVAETLELLSVQSPLTWWERFGFVQRVMAMAARHLRDSQEKLEELVQ